MVKIINYQKREREDGTTFFALELQGGLELVLSKETGFFYATSKKAFITSTFDEATCKSLIGTELPGRVTKVEVEPYPYIVEETGEELILTHRWMYVPETEESQQAQAVDNLMSGINKPSMNGQLEPQDII